MLAALSASSVLAACGGVPDDARESTNESSQEIQLADFAVASADDAGVPTFANGDFGRIDVRSAKPTLDEEDSALRPVLASLRGALRIDPDELVLDRATSDEIGDRHYVFKQYKNGLEVIGAALVLHTRAGKVYAVHGKARSDLDATINARIDAPQAIAAVAKDASRLQDLVIDPKPRLAYRLVDTKLTLIYQVKVKAVRRDGLPVDDEVFVNASDGAILGRSSHVQPAKNRQVYTAANGWTLPGTLVRAEGWPATTDGIVNLHYNLLGTTYDCYRSLFGRDSIDNVGAAIMSSVHFGTSYDNAFWNGTELVFGDGDNSLAGNFALSLDVAAHELTHGVTAYTSGLIYSGESGGLNESMSDIFAAICTWYRDGYVVNANTWKVAEDIWTPATSGDALRYLNDPRADGGSLDYYPDYYSGIDVHYSSGIQNLAFYLLAQGGTHPRGRSAIFVPGVGITKAAQIFYRANTVTLLGNPDATFAETKIATEQAAAQLGYSSSDITSVSFAWLAVGVGLNAPACAHDRCAEGGILSGPCNWCTDEICKVDPYCCMYGWDSICVGEVQSVCNSLQCPAAAPACAHTQCTTGVALSSTCHSCAATICTVDPYCCTIYWDSICVSEVGIDCNMNCL
ncbi:MAG TPA: M4 family metallopeptidase [Kofleriaceae bacterium]|nr:M4 family metallopeptidase [Kofleriaceae bacterium]